ncbi:MAG TPA: efflux RND transporter periplasmic adaptor subunit, partial [Chloroflexota bacterium]|nr:efflux RND transporter periplasmic adaptor subunit [Chloroflexota bacterium]
SQMAENGNLPSAGGTSNSAIQQAYNTAKSNYETAVKKLQELQAGATASELQVAQSSVTSAQASFDSAVAKLELLRKGTTAPDLASAESAVQQAVTSLASAEAKLKDLAAGPTNVDRIAAEASVSQAKASLTSAETKLADLQAGPTNADRIAAEASVSQPKASLTSAEAKLKDLQAGPKPSEILTAEGSLLSAKIALDGKTTVKESDLLPQEDKVRQAEAALEGAKLDLDSATITAPFDGIVSAVSANVGEQVQVAGGGSVVTVVDPKAFRVDVAVDETDVAKLVVGQPATITFDALPDQRLQGKVISVAPTGTTSQGVVTYPVSINVENATGGFPGGMSASISIETERKDNVVLVPNRAVKTQGRNKVVEVKAGEKSEIRTVQVGSSNDQMTEIVSGLAAGDQVVIPTTTTSGTNTNARVPGMGGVPGVGGGNGPPPGR